MKPGQFAKWLVIFCGAVPGVLLCWDAYNHQLGADAVSSALHTVGKIALIFLVLTLAITPLRKLTGLNVLNSVRRPLGLYAFYYASAHFLIFFIYQQNWNVSSTLSEMLKRKFLIVGSIGLLIMLPLALTSTNGMVRRLGFDKWKLLHRLTYFAAVAGAVHYFMSVKKDVTQPEIFLGIFAVLLSYRLLFPEKQAAAAPRMALPPATKKRYWSGKLRVVHVFDETPSTRTIRMAMPEGAMLPFDHMPGQYLNLKLSIAGQRVNRSYTIASSPTQAGYVEITVKREEAGTASKYLHQQIQPGDSLDVSAPAGKFTFTGKESDSIVLIAGGVGITPLMSVVRYLTDRAWTGEIYLLYAARTRAEIIFHSELTYLQKRFPNFHLTLTLTREEDAGWQGSRGRISRDLLDQTVPNLATRLVHLCGPTEMIEPTKALLRDLGVSAERIKIEAFQYAVEKNNADHGKAGESPTAEFPTEISAADAPASAPGKANITFAKSGKMASITPDQTVLEASEDAGVNIEFECRAGVCGTCKTHLLSGEVTMDVQEALTAGEAADNIILACQAHAVTDLILQA